MTWKSQQVNQRVKLEMLAPYVGGHFFLSKTVERNQKLFFWIKTYMPVYETNKVANILLFCISAAVVLKELPCCTGQCMLSKESPCSQELTMHLSYAAPNFFTVVTNTWKCSSVYPSCYPPGHYTREGFRERWKISQPPSI